MKYVLLVVHPTKNSLSHQFSEIFYQELKEKHEVEVFDLYQDKEGSFDFLSFGEDKKPNNDVELRAWREEKVRATDKFIVFFPIWWGDAPAKFKNWYENVFTAKFAYRYTKSGVQHLLKGKRFDFVVTSDSRGGLYGLWLFMPLCVRVIWMLRFFLPGMSLDRVKVFGSIRKRRKKAESMQDLFAKVRKLAQSY